MADQANFFVEPHGFDGPRGNEPRLQSWQGVHYQVGDALDSKETDASAISIRWETEALGRHDSSLDLDRAWWRPSSHFTLGRIHPWELTGNPEATRPWGMAANTQAQNQGIGLGTLDRHDPFPEPVMMGWLGVHAHSDLSKIRTKEARWAFSASPLFVPSLGSQVTLSPTESTSTSRFGRRPPTSLDVSGTQLPLRYRVDTGNLFQDILLQPQAMAQFATPLFSEQWQNYFSVSRSPQVNPDPTTSGFIQVGQESVYAVAVVQPSFPERWRGFWRSDLVIGSSGFSLFHSIAWSQGSGSQVELGGEYAHEDFSLKGSWSGAVQTVAIGANSDANYIDHLLQTEALVPVTPKLQWLSGAKVHLTQNGVWLRTSLLLHTGKKLTMSFGGEAFSGNESAYFGEWRTNDRLWVGMEWRVGG